MATRKRKKKRSKYILPGGRYNYALYNYDQEQKEKRKIVRAIEREKKRTDKLLADIKKAKGKRLETLLKKWDKETGLIRPFGH